MDIIKLKKGEDIPMYQSINYYCRYRETTQEETILHDAYEKISRLHETIETYEVKPKTLRKDIKKEDIVGVLYVSNPQPSMCTIYSYVGLLNHQYIQYTDNAIFKEDNHVKETFETLTSFLVDSYAPSLWTYPKSKYDIIDGHMKDEFNLIDCKTFDEVLIEIDDYMDYYHHHRYQWNLQRMTPKQYGDKLRNKNKKDGRSLKEQPSLTIHLNY